MKLILSVGLITCLSIHSTAIPTCLPYGIDRLVWPAQSPDLNCTENVWRLMKACVSLQPIPANEDEMWKLVSKDFMDRLVDSMPARMRAVIAARGGVYRRISWTVLLIACLLG